MVEQDYGLCAVYSLHNCNQGTTPRGMLAAHRRICVVAADNIKLRIDVRPSINKHSYARALKLPHCIARVRANVLMVAKYCVTAKTRNKSMQEARQLFGSKRTNVSIDNVAREKHNIWCQGNNVLDHHCQTRVIGGCP